MKLLCNTLQKNPRFMVFVWMPISRCSRTPLQIKRTPLWHWYTRLQWSLSRTVCAAKLQILLYHTLRNLAKKIRCPLCLKIMANWLKWTMPGNNLSLWSASGIIWWTLSLQIKRWGIWWHGAIWCGIWIPRLCMFIYLSILYFIIHVCVRVKSCKLKSTLWFLFGTNSSWAQSLLATGNH